MKLIYRTYLNSEGSVPKPPASIYFSVLVAPASRIFIFLSVIPVAPQLWCNCPTTVVQLPHNCGATAPQLWGNGNTAYKNKKKGQ